MSASRSFRTAPDKRLQVYIPLDPNRGGTVGHRVARATRWLWSRCIYPTPSAVNLRMRGKTRDCLNGIETTVRNEILDAIGVPMPRKWRGSNKRGSR